MLSSSGRGACCSPNIGIHGGIMKGHGIIGQVPGMGALLVLPAVAPGQLLGCCATAVLLV